jgi:prophage antirepressor-like protein
MLNIFKNSNKIESLPTLSVLKDDNLLIKQFNDLDITIYGTYEEPLFKAKDIGDLLGIKDIKSTLRDFDKDEVHSMHLIDSLGREQETNMLKEQGLYKILMISRKPIAKQFQKWVFDIIKQIRLKGKYDLEEQLQVKELEYQQQLREKEQKELEYQQQLQAKEQELVRYKNKTYEEIYKNNHVYVLKTDGGYKVGKTKDINNRIKGLQTGNVKDIEVVLDFKTSNSDLLEKVVHYILDRYRCNSNREFFDCDIDYIKNVVTVLGCTIDTLKSTYQHISKDDLVIKLRENVNINKDNLPEYILTQDFIEPNQISAFDYWLDENVIYKENAVLKLQDTIEIYIGNKISTRHLGIYRKKIEKYVKEKYRNIEWEYKQFWISDIKYKGWKNLQIV